MKLISIFIFVLGSGSLALAARPYGSGGCGLGSIVQGPNGNQVMAMTTNDTGTQTFAISSGTSNCVDSGVVKKHHEARVFIELNQHQLANDISKGQGETVSGLAHLYGCSDERDFNRSLQSRYQAIFPTQSVSPDHVEAAIQETVEDLQSCRG